MTEPATAREPDAPPPDDELPPRDMAPEAQFRAYVWAWDQISAGAFEDHEGEFVAVRGTTVLGFDPDPDALTDRVLAMFPTGDLGEMGVTMAYIPRPGDW